MNTKAKKFYLYRVKILRDHQKEMFDDGAKPSEIFHEAIKSSPSVKLNKGGEWKLANITPIGTDGGYFAVGRITKTKLEKFNFDDGKFFEDQDFLGPFARVYYNYKLGIIAIEEKSKLNNKVDLTALRIQDLINNSLSVAQRKVKCVVKEIPNPETFIKKIKECDNVLKFKSNFTGPNPLDADEYFQKPLEVYAEKMKASTGTIQVSGSNLDKNMVLAAARTNAATANGASAKIKNGNTTEYIQISKIKTNFFSLDNDPILTFNQMMDRYKVIRENEKSSD